MTSSRFRIIQNSSAAIFLAAALFLAGGPAALAASAATDNIIVAYKPGYTYSETQLKNALHGVRTRKTVGDARVQEVSVNGDINAKINELRRDTAVAYAEPNYRRSVSATTPNDPDYASSQWNLRTTRADAAWDITRGSTSGIIAVIDTGVSVSHPDLAGKIVAGYDFIDNDSDPTDLNGHGTHVAGIAAAITNNGVGVAGMDWNARLMPVRVLDAAGNGYDSDIASGIVWAADHGAKVINMSLGGASSYPQTMQSAIDYAYGKGVMIVAAAGNTPGELTYPAACNHVVAVAATDSADNRASFSNYGSFVDVAAPGVNIISTFWTAGNGNTYGQGSGTSMASPLVAGLAALLTELYPTWTPDQVTSRIEATADDLGTTGRDDFYGYGRVNAAAALTLVDHFTVEATGPRTAGTAFSIIVTAKDKANATVGDFNQNVTLSDTTGSLSPAQSGAFSGGVWTGNVTITKATDTDRITAVFGASAVTGSSATFVVNPAAPDHISVSPDQISIGIGKTRQLTATVQDVYNNPISGAVINWSATGGSVAPQTGATTTYTAATSEGTDFLITITSGSLSATVKVKIAFAFLSDFGGNGVSDIGMLYDYGNATSRLWAFTGTGTLGATSFAPSIGWFGGVGGFDPARVQIASGDYDGDGKTDIAMLYDYGNSTSRLWVFTASIKPGTIDVPEFTPTVVWYSGVGGFDASRVKLTSGDYNGDRMCDIAMLYDYGNATARLWTFQANGSPGAPGFLPSLSWSGGVGAFDASRVRLTSGDYDGDGRCDVSMLYDYGNATSGFWTFLGTGSPSHIVFQPSITWYGGAGAFDANRVKLTSGDYTGDGKADLAVLYDYSNATSRLWTFAATGSVGAPHFQPGLAWYGGEGAFDSNRVKLTSGDYDGDGRTDVSMLYDYGDATSRLWTFTATGASGTTTFDPGIAWYGGTGAFDASRVKVTN